MHILMLTASLPYPPHQGGAIRAYGILRGLHAAGHRVTLLSFHDDNAHGVNVNATPLASCCERVVTVPTPHRSTSQRLHDLLFSSHADIARRLEDETMRRQLLALLAESAFDLVQFEGIEVTPYLFEVRQRYPELPVIYDSFNAEAALQQVIARVDRGDLRRLPSAFYSALQTGRIRHYERELCATATAVIAVSNEDAAQMQGFRPDGQIYVVPSGIFADDYTAAAEQLDLKPNALVFTGKMDYRPNVDAMLWFADKVLPLVERCAEVNLYIVGQKPHKRLDALRLNRRVHITGWVAAVQPYLHAAAVYAAPLRMGSGTRLKILEAMASGRALVATPTAAAGLMPSAKEHMVITEDPAQMAEAICDLLQHPQKRVKLGEGAQAYIRSHYDWSVLIPALLNVYRDIGFE
jgi:polysaccharide biosynthesis protein PslH